MVVEAKHFQDLTSISEAIALIDGALGTTQHREIMSANEVADLLLDIRGLLVPFIAVPLEEVGAAN